MKFPILQIKTRYSLVRATITGRDTQALETKLLQTTLFIWCGKEADD